MAPAILGDTILPTRISRRAFVGGLSLFGLTSLASCTQVPKPDLSAAAAEPLFPQKPEPAEFDYAALYAASEDDGYLLPAIPYQTVDKSLLRQIVNDPTGELPGTLVVNTQEKFLYFVLPGNKALRYGVGLGRAGFDWKGRAVVQWKRKWPTWTPPEAMIKRQPDLRKWEKGMPPGLSNPLGSRALYIFDKGVDTLYRIHGSPDWKSIGKATSSGCVRMFQQDVIDLYDRVRGKAVLVVI